MGLPGGEAPDTPEEPDVLDGGDVVEGLGIDGLATGSSGVARGSFTDSRSMATYCLSARFSSTN